MSSCVTNDIHSIYLDNEMPEIYKAEYESHLKSCPKCQKELAKLKTLRSLFSSDSINLDKQYMDQSFERLQIKMGYSKHTGKVKEENTYKFKYVIPTVAAAAVAVLALVLPLNLISNKNTADSVKVVAPIVTSIPTADNVSLNTGRAKVISGNIQEPVVPPSAKAIKITVPSVNNIPVQVEIEFPESERIHFRQK